jgi:hypothetical protein
VLDKEKVSITSYAIAVFSILFNCRVILQAEMYANLLQAIEDSPTNINHYIPAVYFETHGYSTYQIIAIAWQHIAQMHDGLYRIHEYTNMFELMNSPLPASFLATAAAENSDESDPEPDILNLLVTAAANNS